MKNLILYPMDIVFVLCCRVASVYTILFVYPIAHALALVGVALDFVEIITMKFVKKLIASLNMYPLTIETWFWIMECYLTHRVGLKNHEQAIETVNNKIYPNMDTILSTLGFLPLSVEDRRNTYAFFDKFQEKPGDENSPFRKYKIFLFGEHYLPTPKFLFKGTSDPEEEK